MNDLQGEVKQLKRMLGSASKERAALSEHLESQARIRERFRRIERMFTRDEARVLRQANNVIIRLIGLNFQSGQASISANHFQLLTKVQDAIKTFPRSKLRIEGHTDSHGSDSVNFVLSKQRAHAVKQYLRASMRIDPAKVAAVGFGETRPVANNETETGRAKNRRVAGVMKPRTFRQFVGERSLADPGHTEQCDRFVIPLLEVGASYMHGLNSKPILL